MPGRIKLRMARKASSVMAWARRISASSPSSLDARRPSSSFWAGVRMQGSSWAYFLWPSTVMAPLSKPMLCRPLAWMYSLARAMWPFSGVVSSTSAPSTCSRAASTYRPSVEYWAPSRVASSRPSPWKPRAYRSPDSLVISMASRPYSGSWAAIFSMWFMDGFFLSWCCSVM